MPIFDITLSRPLRIAGSSRSRASLVREVVGQLGAAVQVGERLEQQVRVDRARRRSRSARRGGGSRAPRRSRPRGWSAGGCPRATRCWCTAPSAEHRRDRDPVGAERRGRRSRSGWRAPVIAALASRAIRSSAASRPCAPVGERPGRVERRRAQRRGATARAMRSSSSLVEHRVARARAGSRARGPRRACCPRSRSATRGSSRSTRAPSRSAGW